MSSKKKEQKSQKAPKAARSDSLTRTTKKDDIELTEEELKRVAGGIILQDKWSSRS